MNKLLLDYDDYKAITGKDWEPIYYPCNCYSKTPIPKQLREQVLSRDGHICKRCGSKKNLAVDHIIPEVRGGTMELDNLQTLCKSCNSRKGARTE